MGLSKLTNRDILMYHSVNVDHKSMAAHLTRSDVKGCKKFCISNGVHGTADDVLWNGSEEDGNDKVSVRKMKALPVKMEIVTLFGKDRWNLTNFVY